MSDLNERADREKKLQDFLMMEKEKEQINAQIHDVKGICWEKCAGGPVYERVYSTETCLSNCVDRFNDTSMMISRRGARLIELSTRKLFK